jgi:hypothetical protein
VVAHRIEGTPEIALFTTFWAPICAYLFRREVVTTAGGFDEGLPILQDAHFVLRAALDGAVFRHVPGVYSLYRVHPGQISRRRDAFVRDVLKQSMLVRAWWEQNGGMTETRRGALVQVLANLARMSYETDRQTFWEACRALEEWSPKYVPAEPRSLRYLTQVFGYPRAEEIARQYRRPRRAALGAIGRLPPEPIHSNLPRF